MISQELFPRTCYQKEISENTQKSLITHLPAGRQGLQNNYIDSKWGENKEKICVILFENLCNQESEGRFFGALKKDS